MAATFLPLIRSASHGQPAIPNRKAKKTNPLRAAVAQGATGAASLDREGESNGIGVDGDVLDLQRSEMRKKLFDVHENLRDDGVGPDDTVCIQCTLRHHRECGRASMMRLSSVYQEGVS